MPSLEQAHDFRLLGTGVRLLVGSAPGSGTARELLAGQVRSRLEEIDRALTRLAPDSELSLLNRHAGEWVRVSPTLLDGIQAALFAARLSGGLVDPTLLRRIKQAGYATPRTGIASASLSRALEFTPARAPASPHPAAEWRRIQVDAARSAVRLPRGLRLDLGGSAKGMAVDVAAGLLAGSPAFAVHAGGDIRIGGTEAAPRTVEVAHPLNDGPTSRLTVSAGAIATSGLRTRVWATPDHGFAHHLIDPARGVPAWTGVIQATALAPTALEAQTRAKMALLRGPLAGRVALQSYGGMLILDSGTVIEVGDLGAVPEYVVADRRTA